LFKNNTSNTLSQWQCGLRGDDISSIVKPIIKKEKKVYNKEAVVN